MKKAATLILVIILSAMTAASMAGCTGSGGSTGEGKDDSTTYETQQNTGENKDSSSEVVIHEAPDDDEGGQGDGNSAGSPDIGYERVKAIVLSKVAGASESDIYELEREYDDGRPEYEGSLYYNGYEYEFEIDGTTGNILQWEMDDDD